MAHPVDATSDVNKALPQDGLKNIDIRAALFAKFRKFDDADNYQHYADEALSAETTNFAVRFGVEEAEIAIGLNGQDVGALLEVQAERKGGKDEKVTWM